MAMEENGKQTKKKLIFLLDTKCTNKNKQIERGQIGDYLCVSR